MSCRFWPTDYKKWRGLSNEWFPERRRHTYARCFSNRRLPKQCDVSIAKKSATSYLHGFQNVRKLSLKVRRQHSNLPFYRIQRQKSCVDAFPPRLVRDIYVMPLTFDVVSSVIISNGGAFRFTPKKTAKDHLCAAYNNLYGFFMQILLNIFQNFIMFFLKDI